MPLSREGRWGDVQVIPPITGGGAPMSGKEVTAPPSTAGLQSFWIGGFEAASHINRFSQRVDLIAGTRHDEMALHDYQLLRSQNFLVARDTLRWHLIDRGSGSFDFSSLFRQLTAARETGVQVIWGLHHYGFPDDVDPLSPRFVDRFARYAAAAGRFIRDHSDAVPYFTPINEISFFSWAGCRFMYPFAHGKDEELKRQLVRTTIEACNTLREIDPRCRFLHTDPIIQVIAPLEQPELAAAAAGLEEAQFEAWDMIAGRRHPELGGNPSLLDIIGMNFYHNCQWEFGLPHEPWHPAMSDPRRLPLRAMVERVWRRYSRPLILAETSHFGVGRGDWITEVSLEIAAAIRNGVPLEGVCLFPIIDRYDWEDTTHWHNSGLWDIQTEDGSFTRHLNDPYAAALRRVRQFLPA